jgi:hypothetical protein
MEDLEELLQQISKIVEKDEIKKEEQRKRGERFNIFNVLNLTSDEVRLHSAFLAELLNVNGSHDCGDVFLKAFIEEMKLQDLDFEVQGSTVETEKDIGIKTETEGGRIDIIITSNNNKAIIIENKIYAGDQENQIIRYNKYGEDKYGEYNYKLLYLTLDGHDVSNESKGKLIENKDYFPISYRDDISKWLKRCIELSATKPLIRETIQQYLNLIKQLTNTDMEKDFNKKIIELVKKDTNNLNAISTIIKQKDSLWESAIIELENKLKNYEELKDLTIEYKYKGLIIYKGEKEYIFFWFLSGDCRYWRGKTGKEPICYKDSFLLHNYNQLTFSNFFDDNFAEAIKDAIITEYINKNGSIEERKSLFEQVQKKVIGFNMYYVEKSNENKIEIEEDGDWLADWLSLGKVIKNEFMISLTANKYLNIIEVGLRKYIKDKCKREEVENRLKKYEEQFKEINLTETNYYWWYYHMTIKYNDNVSENIISLIEKIENIIKDYNN